MKVRLFDRAVIKKAVEMIAAISTVLSVVLLFVDIPPEQKMLAGLGFVLLLLATYLLVWVWTNRLRDVSIDVEGSTVNIKTGDIFEQAGFKVIAFNEYLDTQVDDKVISHESLNGIFINSHLSGTVADLDAHIAAYAFEEGDVLERDVKRVLGKATRYKIGTICVYNDFLLTAFARFDGSNRATLTMPEYLEFLLNFWDRVNRVYAQKSVATTIFGSGITRIAGHKNISDEDLLKIMLWTFRLSEMRFKYPAKLTIVIHEHNIDQINLLEIASARNGV